jgi:hypothetical protein
MRRVLVAVVVTLACAGSTCAPSDPPPDVKALRDPRACASCHDAHYREWEGSMHAYASKDPVFLAMNARGQRETNGALGDFCVRCHAPMAVALGLTQDGLNLPELPDEVQGVTCVFCHSVAAVAGAHNNPLVLVEDGTMRGGISDPIEGAPHRTAYSPLHDRTRLESSALCGACHDIVVPNGFHLERTFREWNESLFSKEQGGLSCSACHMPGRDEPVARVPNAPVRKHHNHSFPGVDIALTDFPAREEQRALVQRFLDVSLLAKLCVEDTGGLTEITVDLENLGAGHAFPSGATQDRRVWVEVRAFLGEEEIFSSGVVEDGQPLFELKDPNLWFIGHRMYDERGELTHNFWDAHRLDGELLPAPTTRFPFEPGYVETHIIRRYVLGGLPPDRVTMRVRMRPMGLDVIDDLIATGDLDPVIRDEIPTYDLRSTVLEWKSESGERCTPAGR